MSHLNLSFSFSLYPRHNRRGGRITEATMAKIVRFLACFAMVLQVVHGENSFYGGHYRDEMRKMHAFKHSSFLRRDLSTALSPSPSPSLSPSLSPTHGPSTAPTVGPRVYHVTSYGADPTGKTDSTKAILGAISDALQGPSEGFLMEGIANLGGAQVDLDGGCYLITRPLRFPVAGRGNLVIHGGTLKASDDFPKDGYILDLSGPSSKPSGYYYEFVTFRDLMLNLNFRGGGIHVLNSLRITINNCYIAHFTTNGIIVQGGHETYISNSFLGNHITAGGDPDEKDFSGTGINLMSNDNAVTDVVIFSAAVGIMVSGQANSFSGVHCYNKATGFGGTGIYLRLPGMTQTRIVNSYMDYTGIVAEDPVQLHVSSTFFLGDAHVTLKSINGVVKGVNVVDNMFSGSGKGVEIVRLDQTNGPFKEVDQVVIDRNNAEGMNIKATVATGNSRGNGTSWTLDFSPILLFPDLINHVEYTLSASGSSFPNHVLRNVSNNRVVIESDRPILAKVFVRADQGTSYTI